MINPKITDRKFVAYFHFAGSTHISLGLHLDWANPNIEIHIPFGFFRIGWEGTMTWPVTVFNERRTWGIK